MHQVFRPDPGSAERLDRDRLSLVRSALAASAGEPTIGDEIWAETFVDAAIAALAGDDDGPAAPPVESRDAAALRRHVLAAVEPWIDAASRGAVAAATETLVRLQRVGVDAAAGEAVDEIDVALGRIVVRLNEADPFTAEHCRAVSAWCGRIAESMRLSRADIQAVRRAGLVHDIGKIATPPEILLAPRTLDDLEFAVMRQHVTAGEAMLDEELLAPLRPAVRWHHERWDGEGYPDRIRAERIPLLTRIVTVADAFNAMIGRRPYRASILPEAALEELRLGRETQFDPEIVTHMFDVVASLATQ